MRDILLHLDDIEECQSVIEAALLLADRLDARLTALFAKAVRDVDILAWNLQYESDRRQAAEVRRMFQEQEAQTGVNGRWCELESGTEEAVESVTIDCSRRSDLVVMSEGGGNSPNAAKFAEKVSMESGRPTLIVPRRRRHATISKRIAVAWSGSRECARALHDALPLLRRAEQVILYTRSADRDRRHVKSEASLSPSLAEHLEAYGIETQAESIDGCDKDAMNQLLRRSETSGADLIVMGRSGQGNSHQPDSGLRHVLKHAAVPVLVSY